MPVLNNYLATTTPWDESGITFSNAPDAFSDPMLESHGVGAVVFDGDCVGESGKGIRRSRSGCD